MAAAPTRQQRHLLLLCGGSLLALQLAAAVDPAGFAARQAHAQEASCFTAGTLVLMADGRERPIETLRPGDAVLGRRGRVNRVVGCERTRLGRRRLHGLNGGRPFATAEHPFLTAEGWKALDPAATRRENPRLPVGRLQLGDRLCRGAARGAGAGSVFVQACSALEAVAAVAGDPETPLFNLLLDGDRSYVADGWIVHNKGGGDGGAAERGDAPAPAGGGVGTGTNPAAAAKASARPAQDKAPSARATLDSFLKALGFRDSADAGLEPKGAPLSRAQERRAIEEGWRQPD